MRDALTLRVVAGNRIKQWPRRTRPPPLEPFGNGDGDEVGHDDIFHHRRGRRDEVAADARARMNSVDDRHRIAGLLAKAKHLPTALLGIDECGRHSREHAPINATVGELTLEGGECSLDFGHPRLDNTCGDELRHGDLPTARARQGGERGDSVVAVADLKKLPADRLIKVELPCASAGAGRGLRARIQYGANRFTQPLKSRSDVAEKGRVL